MAYSNHFEYLTDTALQKIQDNLITALGKNFDLDMSHLIYDPTNFYTYSQDDDDEALPQLGHGKEFGIELRIVGLALLCTQNGGVPSFTRFIQEILQM